MVKELNFELRKLPEGSVITYDVDFYDKTGFYHDGNFVVMVLKEANIMLHLCSHEDFLKSIEVVEAVQVPDGKVSEKFALKMLAITQGKCNNIEL